LSQNGIFSRRIFLEIYWDYALDGRE
jgi:hypothetical protein